MKIVVTGASGFLGYALATHLQSEGHETIGVSRTPPPRADFQFVTQDLRDYASLEAWMAQEKPEVVYHLAALSLLQDAAGPGGARAILEANVTATGNLLEASRRAEVQAVVVASSDKQYGALAATPYDDSDTTAFLNGGVYELSKAQQDQVARLYAGLYDTPAVRVARLANVYGPGDRNWSRIIPGTIRRALDGVAPRLTTGRAGEALREYVFVEDALAALEALAQDALRRGNAPLRCDEGKLARVAFNVGSPHRHAAGEVIAAVQTVLREHGIASLPAERQPGAVGVFEPGSQLSRQERLLELLPRYAPRSLAEGLRETVPWYLERLQQG